MSSTTHRLAGRALLVTGLLVLTTTACQTGQDPEDATPGETATVSPEPTASATQDDDAAEPTPTGTTAPTVNGPNAITSPEPGETVAGPDVTVSGEGTAFEATLNYRVLDADSEEVVVEEDWTMAGANGEVGPFTIDLTLDPGRYTVEVWEPDVSDGESELGPYINLVAVTFTVE